MLNHIITRNGNQATNHIQFMLTWQGLFNLSSEQKSVSQKLTSKIFFHSLSLSVSLSLSPLPLSPFFPLSAFVSPNRSCQQRRCWTWHWLGHGFIQPGSCGLAAPVVEAVCTRKIIIITMDPSLVHCFCKKGKNPDFIKLVRLAWAHMWHVGILGQNLAQCRANNMRTASVPTGTLKFLDWKAWTECSAGDGDIFFSYFISAISLRADWKTHPLQDADSQDFMFIS